MSKISGDPGYRDGWCVHYRAQRIGKLIPGHGTCEAGVAFETWRGTSMERQPCFLDHGKQKPDALPCEHLRLPTPDEIAAHEKWSADHMNRFSTVMAGIRPWREAHKGKSAAEVVECPACGGRLHLSIAAYNGHVHGQCETRGCVSWME